MALNAASEKKLVGVKPDLVKVVRRAAEITTQPFQIVQGARTQAYQDALYAQGRTKPGKIVTWTRNSKHIGGNAVDFAALKNGAISWTQSLYPPIAHAFKVAAKELGVAIEWGGDWKKTKDWGHVQLVPNAKPAPTPVAKPVVQEPKPIPVKEPSTAPYDPADAVKFYQSLGWTRIQAIALVANLMFESGGNVKNTIIFDAKGDKDADGIHRSHGAGQWNERAGRYQQLQTFAEKAGKPWTDPHTQLAFLDHELSTTERRAGVSLRAATTLEDAVSAAIGIWRPSIPHADMRLAVAKKLSDKMGVANEDLGKVGEVVPPVR